MYHFPRLKKHSSDVSAVLESSEMQNQQCPISCRPFETLFKAHA